MIDRLPPQDLASESIVIGSILNDAEAREIALESIRPEDFYSQAHQKIIAVCLKLQSEGVTPDIATVSAGLDEQYQAALIETSGCMTVAGNVAHHCRAIQSKRRLRDVLINAHKVIDLAYEPDAQGDTVLDEACGAFFGLDENNTSSQAETPATIAPKVLLDCEERMRTGRISGLSTGFRSLDEGSGGLCDSDLIIIGGRPGSGKTALALTMAHNITAMGHPVALFSLEMSKGQLVSRLLAAEASISSMAVRGIPSPRDLAVLKSASGRIRHLPLHIDDKPGLTPAMLLSKARRLQRAQGIRLVIVDYLGLMTSDTRSQNRNAEISEISRKLKLIAKTLNIPVIALSQLSRDNEKRVGNHKPVLSDLRDSGSIEQDADAVWFIHREELYDPKPENIGRAELIVAKQRNGPTGSVPFVYHAHCTKFEEAGF